jgi:hypothetical protein
VPFQTHERFFIRAMLLAKLGDLSRDSFQQFFHELMSNRYPDFVGVRAHGRLGDQGADGLSLHGGKLYACYGPDAGDAAEIRRKFRADLASAVRQRSGQFHTFVFVHNGRGIHPVVSGMLPEAVAAHPELTFEVYGWSNFYRTLIELPRDIVEDLIGCPFPVKDFVTNVGLSDLEPLLKHLVTQRRVAGAHARPKAVSPAKLDHNRLSPDDRAEIARAVMHTYLVEEYYQARNDPAERDEVAEAINAHYLELRQGSDDPGEIICGLQEYISGNARRPPEQEYAIMVVLAHFFETCDVFDEPPARLSTERGVA